MSLPDINKLYEVCEATWPCDSQVTQDGFVIRDGKGGGKRVSAATLAAELNEVDVTSAEHAMRALGQTALFQVREGEDAFDSLLADRGYTIIDPVNVYAIPAKDLATERPPRTIAIPAWEPLHIMKEIWAEGGINSARIDVMHRATSPKTGFISRHDDRPAGTAFAAMHEGITMVHALEIKKEHRRHGLARWAMLRAAFWTLENNGHTVSVICTQQNAAANGLYQSLGMSLIGSYHYRIKA